MNEIDVNSSTWKAVKKLLESETESAQSLVNSIGTPERIADYNRGKLGLAETLLNLPEYQTPAITTEA